MFKPARSVCISLTAYAQAATPTYEPVFARYPVANIYHGPARLPNFAGRDRRYGL